MVQVYLLLASGRGFNLANQPHHQRCNWPIQFNLEYVIKQVCSYLFAMCLNIVYLLVTADVVHRDSLAIHSLYTRQHNKSSPIISTTRIWWKVTVSVTKCLHWPYSKFYRLFIHKLLLVVNIQNFLTIQDAVGNGRLRPRCCHLANTTKHTCWLWLRPIPFIIRKHDIIHKTKSTSHYHPRRMNHCHK